VKRETATWLASSDDDATAARLLAENALYSQAVFHTHLWVERR
jgi:hypothetical protein